MNSQIEEQEFDSNMDALNGLSVLLTTKTPSTISEPDSFELKMRALDRLTAQLDKTFPVVAPWDAGIRNLSPAQRAGIAKRRRAAGIS